MSVSSSAPSSVMRWVAPVIFGFAVTLFVVVLWQARSAGQDEPEAKAAPEIIAGSVKKTSKMDGQSYKAVLREDGLVEFYLLVNGSEDDAVLVDEVPVDVAKVIAAHYTALSVQPQSSRVEMFVDEEDGTLWTRSQMRIDIPVLVLWFLAFVTLGIVGVVVHLQYRAYRKEKIQAIMTRGQYEAREAERGRLAGELHDGPIQDVQYLIRSYFGRSSDAKKVEEDGEAIRVILETISSGLRQVCTDLRPPTLHHFGLGMAVQALASSFENRHPDVAVEVEITGDNTSIPENTVIVYYRILQEALNNVAKHAGPCEVLVRLEVDADWVELAVEDNGVGCDLPKMDHLIRDGHFGLSGIVERATTIGAAVEVRSREGKGTLVRAVARLPQPASVRETKKALRTGD